MSTGGAESTAEHVVDQRLKNKGHMPWSRQGTNALLQVRGAVANGIAMPNFMRWYPRHRKLSFLAAPQAS
jgi:hypothetical protein